MSVPFAIKKVTLKFLHQEINTRMDRLEADVHDLRRGSNQRFNRFDQRLDQLYAPLTQILLASGSNKQKDN